MFTDVAALAEVILIDLALSADNAIAVGLAAAALPAKQQSKAVMWGVVIALLLRIAFGLITVQLLSIRGLMLAGGLLLIWIAWRMYHDLRQEEAAHRAPKPGGAQVAEVTFTRALFSIVLANIALSLDNVLAVAGVARNSPAIMTFGLVLSVLMMGVAANIIASVVDKHRWIAYLGVAAIVLAGAAMAWEDLHAFIPALPGPPAWMGGAAAG
jgi:YjbE family integral membrane protein